MPLPLRSRPRRANRIGRGSARTRRTGAMGLPHGRPRRGDPAGARGDAAGRQAGMGRQGRSARGSAPISPPPSLRAPTSSRSAEARRLSSPKPALRRSRAASQILIRNARAARASRCRKARRERVFPVDPVEAEDTTGAGDTFLGGFLAASVRDNASPARAVKAGIEAARALLAGRAARAR